MKPAAVGFDLGETLFTYAGTALNWAERYPAALVHAAKLCAFTLSDAEIASAAKILSGYNTRRHPRREEVGADRIFGEIACAWERVEVSPERFASAFFDFFQQHIRAYRDAAPTLVTLRDRGLRLGALTDVPYGMPHAFVSRDLEQAGLSTLLSVVLTSADVGWRKPETAGFVRLARELGVATPALWYVGNEEKDVRGALAAGAIAIAIDRDRRSPAWGQHATIADLGELVGMLDAPCDPVPR